MQFAIVMMVCHHFSFTTVSPLTICSLSWKHHCHPPATDTTTTLLHHGRPSQVTQPKPDGSVLRSMRHQSGKREKKNPLLEETSSEKSLRISKEQEAKSIKRAKLAAKASIKEKEMKTMAFCLGHKQQLKCCHGRVFPSILLLLLLVSPSCPRLPRAPRNYHGQPPPSPCCFSPLIWI